MMLRRLCARIFLVATALQVMICFSKSSSLDSSSAVSASSFPFPFISVTVDEFGALGDNETDNTEAFRAALQFLKKMGGGEMIVPSTGVYQTGPVNLTSNVLLRVDGVMRALTDREAFPKIDVLPSVGHDYDTGGACRRHPFVFAVGAENITIMGDGTIDGAGYHWWSDEARAKDPGVGRPHLVEMNNVTGLEITGVQLLDSPFWTLHPVYCKHVNIHRMSIQIPWGGFNGDGIDVDSCYRVRIHNNYLNVGDDHVTILSGVGKAGIDFGMPSKDIVIRDNILGTGMGLSVGSSVSGGIEDVLYENNIMNETSGEWGLGIHIKTRTSYGGYIKNVAYVNNTFLTAGMPGGALEIESGYQSGSNSSCSYEECTEISNITFRNNTFLRAGYTGSITCFPARPCSNIVFDHVSVGDVSPKGAWHCENVASGVFLNVTPPMDPTSRGNCNFTMASS